MVRQHPVAAWKRGLRSLTLDLSLRVQAIAALQDGWYGPGSAAPDERALGRAVSLLTETPDILRFGIPFIAPSPDGGVALRWRAGPARELHLEIPPPGAPIDFLLITPGEGGESEQEGTLGRLQEYPSPRAAKVFDELVGVLLPGEDYSRPHRLWRADHNDKGMLGRGAAA